MLRWITNQLDKFKTVYCEDCEHQFNANEDNTIFTSRRECCRMSPLKVDVSEDHGYVKRSRKEHIDSFYSCKTVRKHRWCLKFSPKKVEK